MSTNCLLEQLIDQWHAAVRLDQHQKICELNLKIASVLVSLFDEQLMRQDAEDDFRRNGNNQEGGDEDNNNNNNEDEVDEQLECRRANELVQSDRWQLVDNINRRLRKQSVLIQMYSEVLEFVGQFDRECLELVIDNHHQVNSPRPREDRHHVDIFRRSLRQCIVLLREININSTAAATATEESLWLPSSRINRLSGISFTRLIFDLDKSDGDFIQTKTYQPNEILEKIQAMRTRDGDDQLIFSLCSPEFSSFLQVSTNYRPYLLDKFTLLIALWICSSYCKHLQLGQLASEMIEQIFHQEVNCCQVEELQQLTQVGAIWLSYKKRFMATISRPRAATLLEMMQHTLDDDEDDDEEEDERSRSVSSSSSLEPIIAPPEDPKALLRQLIDDELLVARPCYLCGQSSSDTNNSGGGNSDLMAPIQVLKCSWCSLSWWRPADHYYATYCNSSLEPLNCLLVPLNNLLQSLVVVVTNRRDDVNMKHQNNNNNKQQQVLAVSPSEWIQLALDNCAINLRVGFYGPPEVVGGGSSPVMSEVATNGEQVDISEKFERLIVVRRGDDEEEKENEKSKSDDDEDAFANFSASDDAQVNELISDPIEECLAGLARFFARRYGGGAGGGRRQSKVFKSTTTRLRHESAASETLQFMRHSIKWTPPTPTSQMIAIQAADLVAFDTLNDSINLYLAVSGNEGVGQVWRRPGKRRRQEWGTCANDEGANNKKWSLKQRNEQLAVRACHSRSQLSQLVLGCGRLFSANDATTTTSKCPQCGRQLVDLRAGGFCVGGG